MEENRTLSAIFDLISNEQGLKDTSLLLEYTNQSRTEQAADAKIQAAFRDDNSHTKKLAENDS